ncbi:MAG TPA: hypothetical protein VEI06_16320 [Gemmatimonadaceae bacterium]|nr:hypothetical protein [Gemmatimonadaceae bacterium]
MPESAPSCPLRAPALYIEGRQADGATREFRLPLPPSRIQHRGHIRAFERRAKKAYFAALDGLRTGAPSSQHLAKLSRLAAEARHKSATDILNHLVSVLNAAAIVAGGTPVLPPPPTPLESIVVHCRMAHAQADSELSELLAWPLEWLKTRGYVASRQLEVLWRVPQPVPIS